MKRCATESVKKARRQVTARSPRKIIFTTMAIDDVIDPAGDLASRWNVSERIVRFLLWCRGRCRPALPTGWDRAYRIDDHDHSPALATCDRIALVQAFR